MPETTDKAAPSFIIEALTLQETRLLSLAVTDPLPAAPSLSAYTTTSRAEVLFNSQLDDGLRIDIHTTIAEPVKARAKASAKPRVQVHIAALFQYRGLGEMRRTNALPLPLAWTAISLAYSTLRGMLQVQLASTSFSHTLLPIISPQQLWQPSTPDSDITQTAEAKTT